MTEIDLKVQIETERHGDSLYAAEVIPFRAHCYSFTREGAIARTRERFVNFLILTMPISSVDWGLKNSVQALTEYIDRLVPRPRDIGTSIRNGLNLGHLTTRMSQNMTAHKYRVELTESQKRRLSEVAHRCKSSARTVKRARALLKAEEGQIDRRIAEAHLVAIACNDPPEGHAHWTLKLLADKAVELG